MAVRQVPDWLTQSDYAHRGLHRAGVPENSLAAAQAAMAAGYGIECDIQMSVDGVPMVFHDWELERLTDTTGPVEARTAKELSALRLLGSEEQIPTLEQFLDAIGPTTPLLIEIKSAPDYPVEKSCEAVVACLGKKPGRAAVMSFDPRVPEWLASNASEITRGLVGTDSLPNGFEHVWHEIRTIEQAQPDFLAIDRRDLDCADTAAWREAGKPLLSWTIRTQSDRAFAMARVDRMIAEADGFV